MSDTPKTDALSDFYDLGAVAHYHDQPPFETPARTWLSARSITGKTTVEELLRWADQHAIANLERLEITLTSKANYASDGQIVKL